MALPGGLFPLRDVGLVEESAVSDRETWYPAAVTLNASHSKMLGQQGGLRQAWLQTAESTCSEFRRKRNLLQKAGGCQHLWSSPRTGSEALLWEPAHTCHSGAAPGSKTVASTQQSLHAGGPDGTLAPAIPLTLPSVGICFISEPLALSQNPLLRHLLGEPAHVPAP